MSSATSLGQQASIISADDVIAECLKPEKPTSFFLYAGAGSGKTRSLVNALDAFRSSHARRFSLSGRKIGIITYTNAARDEIERRLGLDPLFHVSTIHSFCWSLIQGFNSDIRNWLKAKIPADIAELQAAQSKGRPGTKTAQDRERRIQSKTKRLQLLDSISAFIYSPNGDNYGKDSLNHAEVMQIASSFLMGKPLMQRLLINRFPFLLIDESQDTNAELVEALFAVERRHVGKFALGLFGDTMQRIYSDGKHDLGRSLPSDWSTPAKLVNYRSAKRIVRLGNALRRDVDKQEQTSPADKPEGHVRLFLAEAGSANKQSVERVVREKMAEIASDKDWLAPDEVTVLALEHHMAAVRLGFAQMFQPLYGVDHLKRGLIDGDLPGIRLFSERILPLVEASHADDQFQVAEILKLHSPLLSKDRLRAVGDGQRSQIKKARDAVNALLAVFARNEQVSFLEVLRCVAELELFEIPDVLLTFIEQDAPAFEQDEEVEEGETLQAWRKFLETPFFQISNYRRYIADQNGFGTHHGVKGLEFKRVMVLIDDSESRGFLYSYEKLFGVTPPSDTDIKNKREGKDTGIERTLRLMYVTCTRAEDSLAVLVYSENPHKVKSHVVAKGWFSADEVMLL